MRLFIAAAWITGILLGADDPRFATFRRELDAYVKIRKEAQSKLPPLPKKATPAEIQTHQQALPAWIRKARADARQGDVFTPEAQLPLRQILKDHLAGSTNRDSRETIKEGNPKNEKEPGEAMPAIGVNALYPRSASLSSVPPLLLQQLPKLPKNIEYRFVGNTLILFDAESNLIIDYMQGVAAGS